MRERVQTRVGLAYDQIISILLAALMLLVGIGNIAMAIPVERTLATGIADSTSALGAKWRKVDFTAQRTGSATLKLSWTGTADMRFQLRRSDNTVIGGNISASTVSPKTYTTNLVQGTPYNVAVWAYSGVGNFTLTITEDFPDTEAPTAPANLQVTDHSASTIALSWNASADNAGVSGYRIYRNDSQVSSTSSTSFLDTNLAEATSYSYYVRAYDAAQNLSSPSATVVGVTTSTTPDTEAPTQVQNLNSTTQTSASVSLNWSPATDNIAVTEYLVYRDGSLVGDPMGTSFVDTNLNAGTVYGYTVVASDAAGNLSEASSVLNVQTLSTPPVKPNIVVINLDDMRKDQLQYLPKIRQWFETGGTNFTNAYVSTPSCCPSRATLMSGRYVHNNGQYNQDNVGANLDLMIQRYLKDSGYFTGHSGKFLHWLSLSQRAPHWDRWTYFKGGYTNVSMRWEDQTVNTQGYSTTITFDKAVDYLNDFESRNDNTPFYMQLTPIAPHSPSTPEAKYSTASVPTLPQVPSHNETDRTDKPPFVSYVNETYSSGNSRNTAMVRTLYTVDDQVDRFMQELQAKGELENTMLIFTSDNGYFLGEHGRNSKFLPYKEAVDVPFLIRWPGHVTAGSTDTRLVTHADIAPTILAAAGVSQNLVPFDGRDILSGYSRPVGLTEYYYDPANANYVSTWSAIHNAQYVYIEYYGQTTSTSGTPSFREYYDMVNDPYQMQNLLMDGNSANDPDVAALSALLSSQKTCSGTSCQ